MKTENPNYYGAYLGTPNKNGNRLWWLMYKAGGYMYDRQFADCPFSVKRQFAVKNPKSTL